MGIEDFLRQFLQGRQGQGSMGGMGGQDPFDPQYGDVFGAVRDQGSMESPYDMQRGLDAELEEEPSLWDLFKSGGSEGAPGMNAYSKAPDMSQAYSTGQIPGLMAVRPQEQFKQQDPFRSLMSFMGGGRQ